MLKCRESLISAYHNYLVNGMLTAGFVIGEPYGAEAFWFLADMVPPGETLGRVSARIYDPEGHFLVELHQNRVVANPGGCVHEPGAAGFRLCYPTGQRLLTVETEHFTNGHLTRIQGKLFDQEGTLRMEPSFEGERVYGVTKPALEAPFEEGRARP